MMNYLKYITNNIIFFLNINYNLFETLTRIFFLSNKEPCSFSIAFLASISLGISTKPKTRARPRSDRSPHAHPTTEQADRN